MTPKALAVRCPAKINWMLRVLARRADGYHELDTVFQAVDLWDTVEIRPAQALTLGCDDPALPTDARNLVLRAAERLRQRGRTASGAALYLRKAIPVGAGLGGGSSDAAGALLLCNRFWKLGLRPAELQPLAAELGADVPFFLSGGTARGTGRGDLIEPLEACESPPILLGCPPFGISTKEVFERLPPRLTPVENGVSLSAFSPHKWPEEKDFGSLVNDLEPLVYEGWPELKNFRDALLEAGASGALLSGSGSTVYGVFPDERRLDEARRRLRGEFVGWRLVATRAVRHGVTWAARQGESD